MLGMPLDVSIRQVLEEVLEVLERVQAVGLGSLDDAVALRGRRGPWAWTGECGLEAPSPVFSFVYGSKRTALQLLYCGAVRVIRNGFA